MTLGSVPSAANSALHASAPGTQVVVVTGLSGAGKSTALAALEDLGFHSIENLPPAVTLHAIETCEQAGVNLIALGFGGSVGPFLDRAAEVLSQIAGGGPAARRMTMIFLDASDEVVARRFNETRRPHPLSAEAQHAKTASGVQPSSVLDGVTLERQRLSPLRAMADLVIDTSRLSVHDLRRRIVSLLKPGSEQAAQMSTRLLSFGFKHGLPSDADVVLDVRFLDNPHFVPELRPFTGENEKVKSYVLAADGAAEFLDHSCQLLEFLLPRYEHEGKTYLTVAIGCTGGQHRSVAMANAIAERLRASRGGVRMAAIAVTHRDAQPSAAVPT